MSELWLARLPREDESRVRVHAQEGGREECRQGSDNHEQGIPYRPFEGSRKLEECHGQVNLKIDSIKSNSVFKIGEHDCKLHPFHPQVDP